MAAPAELREIAEKLVLAGVGAVALTAERADALRALSLIHISEPTRH